MEHQHVKVLDETSSKNRLRFASSKKRALSATANVYRNVKRQAGTTASGREALVHHGDDATTSFTEELDIAVDRNPSEIFFHFHRQVWPLVRSLPELLHHADQVLDLLMSYLLSPHDASGTCSDLSSEPHDTSKRKRYVTNLATPDILHLLGVFAKDLRHEIHGLLHEKIMPRLVYDLLCPPPTPDIQQTPLDVGFIEATFRTMSYIFKYDAQMLLSETDIKKPNDAPCLEPMRRYYGVTLAHRRDLVRRLAAEAFAPLVRKSTHRSKHLKRILRALAASPTPGRTLSDAIDGIARLFAEVARGSAGKLHSKGTVAIQVLLDVLAGSLSESGSQCISNVGLELYSNLRNILNDTNLHEALTLLIDTASKCVTTSNESSHVVLGLLTSVISECRLSRVHCKKIVDPVQLIASDVLLKDTASQENAPWKISAIDLVVTLWTALPDDDTVAEALSPLLEPFWPQAIADPSNPIIPRLVHSLMPSVKVELVMSTLGSQILCAASANPKSDGALQLLHAIASIPSVMEQDSDDLYKIDHAAFCVVPNAVKQRLLDEFENTAECDDQHMLARLKVAAFLIAVNVRDNGSARTDFQRIIKFLESILVSRYANSEGALDHSDVVVLSGAIEALGRVILFSLRGDESSVKHVLQRIGPHALRLLREQPTSILTLKSVALIVEGFQLARLDLVGKLEMDFLFELLSPNLCHRSHFIRQHTLFILKSFPKRPFVVDHAELDLQGDLDEEIDATPAIREGVALSGPCDVLDILFEVETTLPNLSNERRLCFLLDSTGVMAETGRLPVVYSEAVANHLLGILSIRFSPLWSASIKAFGALAKGNHDTTWPTLHRQLRDVMETTPLREAIEDPTLQPDSEHTFDVHEAFVHQLALHSSPDHNHPLFKSRILAADKSGQVSRFLPADYLSLAEHLWQAAEESPRLLTAKDSDISSLAIRFMVQQYYTCGNKDDPNAREMRLATHIALDKPNGGLHPTEIDARDVHRRLLFMLKAFAAQTQPRQLPKSDVLLMIFTSLVGHWDCDVARLAFKCVLRFRLPFVSPYAELLLQFFDKKGFRDSLMNLREASDAGVLLADHRIKLAPILWRIIFGRLSAKSTASKSSKDDPSARRSAAMSFMSAFSQTDEEIYPFIYLVVRGYISSSVQVNPVETQENAEKKAVLRNVTLTQAEISIIPFQMHQGFLNNLEAMLANLQSRLSSYIPMFLSLTLSITKTFEVSNYSNSDAVSDHSIAATKNGASLIRSLCYRRLSDIYSCFAEHKEVVDQTDCLLKAVQNSIPLLPSMAVDSQKPPALLLLLRTLAKQQNLFPKLAADPQFTETLLHCFSVRAKPSVTAVVLDIIEVMVGEQAEHLSTSHVGLLLGQYELRLNHAVNDYPSWRRELEILLRVSEILGNTDELSASKNALAICRALIPFLHTRANGDDKLRVVGVLRHLAVLVPFAEAAEIFKLVSCLFGLNKTRPVLAQIDLRKQVAETLLELSEKRLPKSIQASKVLVKLCSTDPRKMEEIDNNAVIEALSFLGDSQSDADWKALYDADSQTELELVGPVVGCCFCFLLNSDGVVTRTALKALSKLISILSHHRGNDDSSSIWNKFLESSIMPTIRSGLTCRDESARSYFISLTRCVVRNNALVPSIHLHTELFELVRDDQDDLDFFVNIRHVQIHRRARALQRLRKTVNSADHHPFSPNSVSSILLPLAIHPIYESQSKAAEPYALEGIATAGCLARLLPWNKYNSLLWTHLTQFERHPKQEKYLIGFLCALIESFHYEIGSDEETCAVARGLNKRLIPKVEGLLTKKVDGKGTFLRPTVAIALLKLFQKLPSDVFLRKLNRLLKVICNELRNRDSNARDVARNALAKMVTILEIKYLSDVVRELAVSLNEGYKLHVRTAALHTILCEIIKVDDERKLDKEERTHFHGAIPGIMDLIQRDLFHEAQDRRDAQGSSRVKFVKEAQGSKAINCLEIVACLIDTGHTSLQTGETMHMLVAPFLERLRDTNVSPRVVGRVKDSMVRIAAGFLKNRNLTKDDIMMFVRVTLTDFISDSDLRILLHFGDGDLVDDDEILKPIIVSGSKIPSGTPKSDHSVSVTEWRPNVLRNAETGNDAHQRKKAEESKRFKVVDGASAPKMTGSMRRTIASKTTTIVDDLKTRIAVVFCLNLLSPTLKNTAAKKELYPTLDNFVPLLTACACCCRDTEVVLLSFRCLTGLTRLKLPKMAQCSHAIASKSLDMLTSSSGNQEQLQTSFKMMTLLLAADDHDAAQSALPIDADHMPVLISFLRESIISGDQCTQALGLLKSILGHRFISVELYDLMDVVLEQTVRSSKEVIRSQSASAFVTFLINYPLSSSKVQTYLKLVVANVSYEMEQGRLSAIMLASLLVERLPEALLEECNAIFFIPLCLQLTNEDVPDCCSALQTCIGKFLQKLQLDTLQTLFEYTSKWSKQKSEVLLSTSVHVFRIFLKQRPDFIKRQSRDTFLVETLTTILEDSSISVELVTLSLGFFEDLCLNCRSTVSTHFGPWNALVKICTRDSLEIRMASCKILDQHVSSIDPAAILQSKTETFLSQNGLLFQVGRAMCFLIDKNDEQDCGKLTSVVVKLLTWTLRAMNAYPKLCSDPSEDRENDPVHWVMKRLSSIAKHKGIKRQSVYKCFAAFATHCGDFCFKYLELMLEPLCRSETEKKNEPEKSMYRGLHESMLEEEEPSTEAQLVKDVMSLLEEKCPEESLFLEAWSNVKARAHDKKEKRKVEQKTEAVTNPQVFAQKKIAKQQREKQRRKRKVDGFRSERGSSAKRKHF